jgi:uncharacterized tellurite resistance protein B-like protein
VTDFTTEQLRLAFAHHTGQKIIAADRALLPEEMNALRHLVPRAEMVEAGLVDQAGGHFTPLFEEAVQVSFTQLGLRLSPDDKLELLRIFVLLGGADGEVHPNEAAVISKAWEVLGEEAESLPDALERL